jgi:hypothetical protein
LSWEVEYTEEFETWWSGLDADDQDKITAAVETLEEHGPNLKRPVVGEIVNNKKKKLNNLKELIPPASDIRILFAFDPRRAAILLLGGDKSGNWDSWYDDNVPVAAKLYADHLEELRDEDLI